MITGEATVTARVYYKIEDIAPADPSNPPDQSYFIAPKKANAKARTLPRTGDPTSMMAIAAMATAGAGLVMAGYRRRR